MPKYIILLLIILTLFGCKKEEQSKPIACFSFSQDTLIKIGDTVKFQNCSENATSYFWDFGDGTTSNDSVTNHIYTDAGEYTVTLNLDNGSDLFTKIISISDQYFQDLGNKTIVHIPGEMGSEEFNIDLNGDDSTDLIISSVFIYGTFLYEFSETYIEIAPKNGYEICINKATRSFFKIMDYTYDTVKTYDSIAIPTIYKINDMIQHDNNYYGNSIVLVSDYCQRDHNANFYTDIQNLNWVSPEYRYIVFRNKTSSRNELAWLKVRVNSEYSITLNSSRCFINKNLVPIED